MRMRIVLALVALLLVGLGVAFAVTPSTTTPSTTTSRTATPTASRPPTTGNPAWPDATNTGVPAGTVLTPSDGLVVGIPGAVIEGRDITGTLLIRADHITVRNTRITGAGDHVVTIADGVIGARLEDVEIDGTGQAEGANGVYGAATILRADIHGVENGIQPDTGSVIRDSWIHDLAAPGDPHYDGIQIDGDRSHIVIAHNTIDMSGLRSTATVMINNNFGPVEDVTVEDNRLLGGGWTVHVDSRFTPSPITKVAFTDNRIGGGRWGHASVDADDPVWAGNVDDSTGRPIPQP